MGKGKKKGWKRLPRDVDETLHDVNVKRKIAELPDEEMFFEDTTALPPDEEHKKAPELTFKQKAALNHKLYKSSLKNDDVDMKDFERKTSQLNYVATNGVKSKPDNSVYDLWGDEEKQDVSTSNGFEAPGVEFYNKVMRKTRRKVPTATRFIPTITPVVEIPSEGASYNPTLESYVNYANDIAREELKMEKDEKRISKKVPAKIVAYINPTSEFEDFKTLLNKSHNEEGERGEDELSSIPKDNSVKPIPKPKTIKQKKKALLRKKQSQNKKEENTAKKQLQQLVNLKKTRREVLQEEEEHKAKIAARKQKKVLDVLTKRKRLGRGEFKDYEQPILLTDELTGSLRALPSRGNILEERFKSLQKRNILPIGGERKKSNRKASLKVKFVEKRSAKDVTKGSRVI